MVLKIVKASGWQLAHKSYWQIFASTCQKYGMGILKTVYQTLSNKT
jgi:hypothetical protein